jgi:hypothetical protein
MAVRQSLTEREVLYISLTNY